MYNPQRGGASSKGVGGQTNHRRMNMQEHKESKSWVGIPQRRPGWGGMALPPQYRKQPLGMSNNSGIEYQGGEYNSLNTNVNSMMGEQNRPEPQGYAAANGQDHLGPNLKQTQIMNSAMLMRNQLTSSGMSSKKDRMSKGLANPTARGWPGAMDDGVGGMVGGKIRDYELPLKKRKM